MGRPTILALTALSIVCFLFPLTIHRPGMPATLKADEPAYYLMALSLVHDFDLRCEPRDLERLYVEFPYTQVNNLILATDDGWHTVFFGKPYLFSLLAAPMTALWGANGMFAFNMLLFLAMIWMGAFYLRRHNPDAPAALFAVGFFVWSTAWTYVFWLHPEVINMFSTAACLFFGLTAVETEPTPATGRWQRWLRHPQTLLALSGTALAIGAYNKPMIAAMGLPVVFELVRRRRFAGLGAWLGAAALTLALACGLCWMLIGHPTAYLGIDRSGFTVDSPDRLPVEPIEIAPQAKAKELVARSAGWEWIFRFPSIDWVELRPNLGYFFWGRHTGLFLYQPWSLLALLLFLAFARRSAARWVLAASLAGVALFFLIFISFNWHGGGGFVGNRYFIIVYPAFLFLVTRIRPDWSLVAGHAGGGLLVGSLVLSPFGAVVPFPTLQAHARSRPLQLFPLEHTLLEIPGYNGQTRGGLWIFGRKDQLRVTPEELYFQGADDAEAWIQSEKPLQKLAFEVRSLAPGNPLRLALAGADFELVASPEPQRVEVSLEGPKLLKSVWVRQPEPHRLEMPLYRLRVRSETGELPFWNDRDAGRGFYVGAIVRLVEIDGRPVMPSPEPQP